MPQTLGGTKSGGLVASCTSNPHSTALAAPLRVEKTCIDF